MKVEKRKDTFIAYADGSALKTKQGGWAVAIYIDGEEVSFSGSQTPATNNQMELTAAIKAVEALPTNAIGVLRTDSNYVVQGVNVWRAKWEKNGWKSANRKEVLNKDLWVALLATRDAHPKIRFQWVKGHADDPGNIRVDELALAAAQGRLKQP